MPAKNPPPADRPRRNEGGSGDGTRPSWRSTGATPTRRSVSERTPQAASRGSGTAESRAAESRAAGSRAAGTAAAGKGSRSDARPRRRFDYPRSGKGPIHRWLPSWRVVLGTMVTGIAAMVGVFVVAYLTIDIPEPDDFALAQGTRVYYADGETEMGRFATYDREVVALDSLPEHVGQAVIASEDRRFYENVGVDPIAIGRALWNNIRGNPTQGGSTLTQQYVERYYIGTTTSYTGKFREAILAIKIDREQSKDAILENYLNTIYFGRGAYGIESASQQYFGKPAAELTISESALLAGIIPAPNSWDPRNNAERAEQRWARVLNLMTEDGWITEAQRAEQEFPDVIEYDRSDTYGGPQGYLLDMVRRELVDSAGLSEDEIDTLGLSITTTIDPRLQQAAVNVVDALPEDRPENNRVALVSIDPDSGAIVALYGGPDFVERPRNAVTQDVAQAGSTFKPFTLVAALEDGHLLEETFPSYSPMEVEGFENSVNNYDTVNRGTIDLVTATAHSVNTVYAQLNVEVGPQRTVEAAVAAGLPADTLGLSAVPANVLGPSSSRPIDMARAYATFAAQGVRHETYIVEEVVTVDGEVYYTGAGPGEEVFDADVMAETTYALQSVVEEGTGVRARELGRPVAGKTGTSNDARSAWFAGYVPQLTTVVAMYQIGEDGGEESITPFGEYSNITGSTYPTTMWRDFMAVALEGVEVQDFPERPERAPVTTEPQTTQEPQTTEPAMIELPGVVGMSEGEAASVLEALGLQVSVTTEIAQAPEGEVIGSVPGAGQVVEPGSTVTIIVSTGPPEPSPSPTPSPTPSPSPSPSPSPTPSPSPSPTPSPSPSPTDDPSPDPPEESEED